MKRLSADELRAARKAQDWKTLWEQAIPLVKFTMSSFIRGGMDPKYRFEDALQSAYLAVGQAVRTWDPGTGEFSTWIMFRAQGAIVNYINKEQSGVVGGRDAEGQMYGSPEEHLATVAVDFATLRELEEEEVRRTVRDWLFTHSDDPLDHEIICYRFGIGDYPLLSIIEIASRVKRPYRTVKRRLQKSLQEMARLAEKSGYMSHEKDTEHE